MSVSRWIVRLIVAAVLTSLSACHRVENKPPALDVKVQKQPARAGIDPKAIDVAWVPGAFEVPLVADRLAASRQYAAVLCLGAVIRGETTHDQHINRAVSLSLMESGVRSGVPVLFGILTCDTLEQAIHRAGGRQGNKGAECAEGALQMVNLLAKLPG